MSKRGLLTEVVWVSAIAVGFLMTPVVATSESDAKEDLTEQLRQAETTFAATMAERDFEAFQEFLAEEAVFFNGETELRGRQAVAAAWKTLFEDSDAPFSWRPEVVSVLDSGTLGLSSGPVLDPQGNRVGTFLSLWRREANGQWRIVFDRECPWCALD